MGFNEKQTLDLCIKLNPLNEWLILGFEDPQTLIEAVQHRAQCWKPTEMDSTGLHQDKTADAQNDGSFAEQLLWISKKHSSKLAPFFVAFFLSTWPCKAAELEQINMNCLVLNHLIWFEYYWSVI